MFEEGVVTGAARAKFPWREHGVVDFAAQPSFEPINSFRKNLLGRRADQKQVDVAGRVLRVASERAVEMGLRNSSDSPESCGYQRRRADSLRYDAADFIE